MSVILLREPKDKEDTYEEILQDSGYVTKCVPVLDHEFVNADRLGQIIAQGPQDRFSGVIITSQRAAEAWTNAWDKLADMNNNDSQDDCLHKITCSSSSLWSTVPFFAVGPATAEALSKIHGVDSDKIKGKESGNALHLAQHILDSLYRDSSNSSYSSTSTLPLLFLSGEKRSDTIPTLLKGKLQLEEVTVYRAFTSPSFPSLFQQVLNDFQQSKKPLWIIFFSPSGAKAAYPIIQKNNLFSVLKLASIGPSTTCCLERDLNLIVHASATSPQPKSLCKALESAQL